MNEALRLAREEVQRILAQGTLSEVLQADGLDYSDLQQLVRDIYVEEVEQLDMDDASEGEQQEIIQNFVERIAILTGLACLALKSVPEVDAAATVVLTRDELSTLFSTFMSNDEATIRFVVQR